MYRRSLRHYGRNCLGAMMLVIACTSCAQKEPAGTVISGVVLQNGSPVGGVQVEALDAGPRFQGFGLAGPIPLGSAFTGENGQFHVPATEAFRREHLAVWFRNRSNLDSSLKIVDVDVEPKVRSE